MRFMSKFVPVLLLFVGSALAATTDGPVLYDSYGREIWTPQRGRIVYPPGAPAPKEQSQTTNLAAPASATALSAPLMSSADLELAQEWYRVVLGTGIGWTGLHVADIDQDGQKDVVAGGGGFGPLPANRYWYVLSRRGTGYVPRYAHVPYPSDITSLQVGQVDADPQLEILFAVGMGIQIYDGLSLVAERSFLAPTGARDIKVADVDADGAPEIVFVAAGGLYVHDAATGTLEYHDAAHGGQGLAVGQLDADAALELVVGRDDGTIAADPGFVIDGLTHVVEWDKADGFGRFVRTGDVDGDGLDEIVAGVGGGIQVFHGNTHTLAWSVPVFDLGALRVLDVEQDATAEVVYGDNQWGGLHVLAGHDGTEKWGLDTQDPGVTDIAMGDVDGDGVSELLWGTGQHSSGPDYLHVVDPLVRVREWRSIDIGGPFYALDSADIDADGSVELAHAAHVRDTGFGSEAYFIHEGATKALEYESPSVGLNAIAKVWRLRTANVDADPQREIFLATAQTHDGLIVCRDGLTHEEQWRTVPLFGAHLVSMQIADVDADGSLEVVAGTLLIHSGAEGSYVYVYDAATGALEWRSPPLPTSGLIGLLRVADVTGDTTPEIVAATSGFDTADQSRLWILDGGTGAVLRTVSGRGITSLDTPDRDGNGKAEIVVGTLAGAIQVLDPATGAVTETLGTFGSAIYGLTVKDVVGSQGRPVYVYARSDQLRLLREDGGIEVTLGRPLGTDVARHDSLMVANVDADPRHEIVVNVGPAGFMVFDLFLYDTAVPTIAVTSPAAGSTVTGSVTVSATASDLEGLVVRVDFFVGGTLLGSDDNAPYEVAWNTAAFAGPRVLTARAYDNSGNAGVSAGVTVNVSDVVPPSALFESLTLGALLRDTAAVGVVASDNVGVTRVDLLLDGVVVGSDATAPYSVTFDTTAHADGSHQLVARAYDAAGFFGDTTTLTVGIDNTPPTAVVTQPAAGATLSGTVTIMADAADFIGVARVEFYVDGVVLTTDTLAPYQATWNATAATPGPHVLSAVAVDRVGHRTDSLPVTVTVFDPAPVVTITAPVFGAMLRNTVSLAAAASDNAAVTRVEFYVDDVLRGTDTAAPYNAPWNTTTSATGNHVIVAKAYDTAGSETASAPIWVTSDNLAPTVSIDDPANGSTVSGTFTVTASALDELSVARVDFLVDGVQKATDSAAPFTFEWPTTSYANGAHALSARATDRAANSRLSATLTVAVSNSAGGGTATYDAVLKAPRCVPGLSSCDSGTLLQGRGTVGPESAAPNTLKSSCADNNAGSYRVDESTERIVVSTLDDTPLAAGKRVRIDVSVWAWAGFMTDRLDIYVTNAANSAVSTAAWWTLVGTLTPGGPGLQVLSVEHTLAPGALQAVRARFRHAGSPAICSATAYADHDDLIFAVQ